MLHTCQDIPQQFHLLGTCTEKTAAVVQVHPRYLWTTTHPPRLDPPQTENFFLEMIPKFTSLWDCHASYSPERGFLSMLTK